MLPDSQTWQALKPNHPQCTEGAEARRGEVSCKGRAERQWAWGACMGQEGSVRDQGHESQGERGPRFLLTPGWGPEDQDPTGPGWRAASLCRVFERGPQSWLARWTIHQRTLYLSPVMSCCVTLDSSLASVPQQIPVSLGALWSSGEKVTDSGYNDSYYYENVTQPSRSPLPPADLEPHTSLLIHPLSLSQFP